MNYTSYGIRLGPILFCLLAFDIVVSFAAFYRRERSKDPYLPFDLSKVTGKLRGEFRAQKKVDRVLTIVLVLAIASSLVALTYVVAFPREGEHFSEFYILGPTGNATDYPSNLTVGEQGSVILGIANHEYQTVNYTVQVWLANATFANNQTDVHHLYYMDEFSVVLNSVPVNTQGNWTAQYQRFYNFSVPIAGQYKLWFVLLENSPAFDGSVMTTDYAGSAVATNFVNEISSNTSYTLDLNLNVK